MYAYYEDLKTAIMIKELAEIKNSNISINSEGFRLVKLINYNYEGVVDPNQEKLIMNLPN